MDRTSENNARDDVATISSGVVITGEVSSTVDLQIDGQINGDVRCTTLFLGESGLVKGNVHAERIRVSGAIEGNVIAGDLAVETTGRIRGDIGYDRLKVTAGAVVEGMMKHRANEPAGSASDPGPLKLVEKNEAAAQPRRVFVD